MRGKLCSLKIIPMNFPSQQVIEFLIYLEPLCNTITRLLHKIIETIYAKE